MPRTRKPQTARSSVRSPKQALEARRTKSRRPKGLECARAPGPGTYRPQSMTDVGVSPACGVHYREPRGTHRRMADAKMLSPGPGSYNPLKPFGSGVFTTNMDGFCSRHMAHEQVNVRAMNAWSPGPACYLPHYGASSEKTNAVSCRIAGAVRNCHEVPSGGTSPGPAAYRLEINNYKPSPPSTRFGKEERITGLPRKGGPGPGAYKPLSCKPLGVSGINGFTKSTPMVNGRPMQYPNNNPPPNKYNPKNNFTDTLSQKGGLTSFAVAPRFAPIQGVW